MQPLLPLFDPTLSAHNPNSMLYLHTTNNAQVMVAGGVPLDVLQDFLKDLSQYENGVYIRVQSFSMQLPLFLGEYGLQAKPYWFNHVPLFPMKTTTKSALASIPTWQVNIDSLNENSEKLGVRKADLASICLIHQFTPNPWISEEASSKSLLKTFKQLEKQSIEFPVISDRPLLSIADLRALAKKHLGAYTTANEQEWEAVRKELRDQRKNLFGNNGWKEHEIIIDSLDVSGQVIKTDILPGNFNLGKLDMMVCHNLNHFSNMFALHVHDPFQQISFLFYPPLINHPDQAERSIVTYTMGISVGAWLYQISSGNMRTRSSLMAQAVLLSMNDLKDKHVEHFANQSLLLRSKLH